MTKFDNIVYSLSVTNDEKKAAIKTGRIIRASRKGHGWTQVGTAQKIGISQSALSKMEAGQLIPSVHQWFEFCIQANIPADSHIMGYLDRMEPVSLHERLSDQGFKVKKPYADFAGSTARSLFPLLRWAEQKLGIEKSEDLWKEMGVDSDYFVDFSNPINFRFYADMTSILKNKGFFKKTDFSKLLQPVSDPKNHGFLSKGYFQASDVETLFKTAFARANYYEVNFEYQIDEVNRKRTVFSARPREHLKSHSQLHLDDCSDFLCDYRGNYFKNLSNSVHVKTTLQTKELSCYFKGADRCVHEISYS